MHPNFQQRFPQNNNMPPPNFQGQRFPQPHQQQHLHQRMPPPQPPQSPQQQLQPQIVRTLPPGAVVVNNPQNVLF